MDLFDNADANTPLIDDNKNYLEELVGEGKKFKDVESLAKGKMQSDLYIQTLTRQLDQLREDHLRLVEEYQSGASLKELLDQLKQQASSNDNTGVNEPSNNKPAQPAVDLEQLVTSKIREFEESKKQEENARLVYNKLKERYGDNYQNVLEQQIQNLGLSKDFVNNLARSHPQVLLKTLGIDQEPRNAETYRAPPRSGQRNDNFAPTVTKRTWSYYEKMRKENPKLYFDPKTNVQIHKDALELGDAFFDTD